MIMQKFEILRRLVRRIWQTQFRPVFWREGCGLKALARTPRPGRETLEDLACKARPHEPEDPACQAPAHDPEDPACQALAHDPEDPADRFPALTWPAGMAVRPGRGTAFFQERVIGSSRSSPGKSMWRASSSLAIALRCTSSGPSARRSVRLCAHIIASGNSSDTPAAPCA
jgi:hypothetical protein